MPNTTASDLALAQLSGAAYDAAPPLPTGFTALGATALPLSLGAGQSFSQGLYQSANAAALVTTGVVDGLNSLVVAFRGSDDRLDSLNSLRDINADYAQFQPLLAAIEAAAASGAYQQIVLTGHSLGGSLAQQFMARHDNLPGQANYTATTFGSPGALIPSATDYRIENFVVADDPAVLLGANRAEAGEVLRGDSDLARSAAERSSEVFPGLTTQDALDSLPFLTADYVNRGNLILLPAAGGGTGVEDIVSGISDASAARHAVGLYVQQIAAAQAGSGVVVVPETGGDAQAVFQRSLYRGDAQSGPQVEALLSEVLRDLGSDAEEFGNDLSGDIQSGLNDISQSFGGDNIF